MITALLGFLPLKTWGELAAVLAIVAGLGWAVHHERELGRQEVQVKWDAERALQKKVADAAAAQYKADLDAKEAKLKGIQDDAQRVVDRNRADLAGATDAVQRLQHRLAALARGGQAPAPASAAAGGAPASSPAGVLADVCSRLAETSRLYAAVADARGAAGGECERSADVITAPSP